MAVLADRTRAFDSSGIRKVFDLAAKMKDAMLGRASGRHYLAFTGKERLVRTTPQPTALA